MTKLDYLYQAVTAADGAGNYTRELRRSAVHYEKKEPYVYEPDCWWEQVSLSDDDELPDDLSTLPWLHNHERRKRMRKCRLYRKSGHWRGILWFGSEIEFLTERQLRNKIKPEPEPQPRNVDVMDDILQMLDHLAAPRREAMAVLGVETRDAATIQATYRKLAAAHHPDHGGDAVQFRKVQQAYEMLIVATSETGTC